MLEHSLATRDAVQEAYLYSGKTQKQIAEEFHVGERTIRYWIKQFQWHVQKHNIHHPPASFIDGIRVQLTNLQHSILSSDSGAPTLQQAQVMQKLVLCLMRLNDHPELCGTITPPLDDESRDFGMPVTENKIQDQIAAIEPPSIEQTSENKPLTENTPLPPGGNEPATPGNTTQEEGSETQKNEVISTASQPERSAGQIDDSLAASPLGIGQTDNSPACPPESNSSAEGMIPNETSGEVADSDSIVGGVGGGCQTDPFQIETQNTPGINQTPSDDTAPNNPAPGNKDKEDGLAKT